MNPGEQLEFCPVLAELFRTRQVVGQSGKVFEGLAALSSLNNLVTLRKLMLHLRPTRTLEVGLSFGGSCLMFTASHRDLGHSPMKQHLAIDPFQTSVWDQCGLLLTTKAGLDEFLDFRPSFSSVLLPQLLSEEMRFDLIYVDGSHLFESVFIDAYFAARLLQDSGVIVFDDSTNPHVQKVLKFLRTNCRQGLAEVDLGPFRDGRGSNLLYGIARRMHKLQMTAFRRMGVIERAWDSPFYDF